MCKTCARTDSSGREASASAQAADAEVSPNAEMLAFTRDGQYDLSTPGRRLAAARATLEYITIIPQLGHSRGPEWTIAQMKDAARRMAVDLAAVACNAPCMHCESTERTVSETDLGAHGFFVLCDWCREVYAGKRDDCSLGDDCAEGHGG